MCVDSLYIILWSNKSNWKETYKYTQPAKLAAAFFFCLFFCPLFQIREQGRVFEEASCRNASHQCSCSSAVLHAAVRASCTVFPIPVVWNRLRSAHPDNRKVVSLSFPTVFICKSSRSHPQCTLSLRVGMCCPFLHENNIQIIPQTFLWLNVTVFSSLKRSFSIWITTIVFFP